MNRMLLVFLLFPFYGVAADPLTSSIKSAAQGMKVQSERLKVVSQNIANSNVTGINENDEPYRRKQIIFKSNYDENSEVNLVDVESVIKDKSDFILKYEPYHPAADKNGYVKYPNVNIVIENADAKEAQRSFEANLRSYEIAKSNQQKLIETMK